MRSCAACSSPPKKARALVVLFRTPYVAGEASPAALRLALAHRRRRSGGADPQTPRRRLRAACPREHRNTTCSGSRSTCPTCRSKHSRAALRRLSRRRSRSTQRVVACDRKACARGVRPGIAVPAARALAHDLVVRPRDSAEETEALLGVAGWAVQFTPNVAHESPDALVLEISGSLRLFGGVDRLRASLLAGCARMGFTALAACAPTARGAAWLARAGVAPCHRARRSLESALAAVPLGIAVRAADTLEALHAIGARDGGRSAALPRDGLARRFGQALARRPGSRPRATARPARVLRPAAEIPCPPRAAGRGHAGRERCCSRRGGCSCSWRVSSPRAPAACRRLRAAPLPSRGDTDRNRRSASSRLAAMPSHFTLLARERLGSDGARASRCAPSPSPRQTSCRLSASRLPCSPTKRGTTGRTGSSSIERLRARLGTASGARRGSAAEHRPEYASRACELRSRGEGRKRKREGRRAAVLAARRAAADSGGRSRAALRRPAHAARRSGAHRVRLVGRRRHRARLLRRAHA